MLTPEIRAAAYRIRRPDEPRIPGIPRQMITPTIHSGSVLDYDIGRNVLGLQFNDPSLAQASGIGVLQAYTADRQPQVGDRVRALYYGNQVLVVGRLVTPTGVVIL